ncbi:MAG: DUF6636 domain-containing protein [Gaiellaceae bacterium]
MSPRCTAFVLVFGVAAIFVAQALGGPSARAARSFHFRSPSGNINCRGNATGVTCLLRHNSWKRLRPRPASCDVDWSPTDMSLFRDSRTKRWGVAVGGCRGDIGPLCYPQDPCVVVKYGTSITASANGHGIRCTSRASGMTCARFGGGAGDRGFRIARQAYAVLR